MSTAVIIIIIAVIHGSILGHVKRSEGLPHSSYTSLFMKIISLLCKMKKTVNYDPRDLLTLAVTALGELRSAPFQEPRETKVS